jgi:hypothetical protein
MTYRGLGLVVAFLQKGFFDFAVCCNVFLASVAVDCACILLSTCVVFNVEVMLLQEKRSSSRFKLEWRGSTWCTHEILNIPPQISRIAARESLNLREVNRSFRDARNTLNIT